MASSISSGVQTTDQLLWTGRNRINAITVFGDGTNAASLAIYDNTSAANKIAAQVKHKAADVQTHIIFENPVLCENGIYADVTGTNASYIVFFGG